MSSIYLFTSQVLRNSPLRHPMYLVFFLATIGTAIGYTMQSTIAAWLMSTLTTSAYMVAMVQTATSTPALLFGLIAGSLADMIDRRKIILVTQWVMLIGVGVLGAVALLEKIHPFTLLLLTFFVGSGFAFYIPAQLASVNEFVTRSELPKALALSAVSFNVARAIGPALAGLFSAKLGAGVALVLSAMFFAPMTWAIKKWKRDKNKIPGVPERILAGVRSGLRYAWHSDAMRALILRNFYFSLSASAFWALLPLIAKNQLGLGADGFGLLFAGFGSGAVLSASLMPNLMKRLPLGNIVTLGVILWAVALSIMTISATSVGGVFAACIAGFSWVVVLACLSSGTQTTAPAWVRARAVSMYLAATQAGLAIGSVLWGVVATFMGLTNTLTASVALMLLLHLSLRKQSITLGAEADVLPHTQIPDLALAVEPMPDDGPVLIQIEYCIEKAAQLEFLQAMHLVGPTRRRSGAVSWRVFRDLSTEDRFIEQYVIASWADYLRQRARMTLSDRELQTEAQAYQKKEVDLKVSRLLGVEVAVDMNSR